MSTENGKILNHLLFCTSILDSFFKLSEGRFSVFFMPFLKKNYCFHVNLMVYYTLISILLCVGLLLVT